MSLENKKKGITKEQEEELIKKQALLFEQCQMGSQNEMLPSELQKSYQTSEQPMIARYD